VADDQGSWNKAGLMFVGCLDVADFVAKVGFEVVLTASADF
jgi:hypothetical protein